MTETERVAHPALHKAQLIGESAAMTRQGNDRASEVRRRSDPAGASAASEPAEASGMVILHDRVVELELRLRDRVEESHVLNEAIQCLEAEQKVRDEYITSIEPLALRLLEVEQQCHDLEAARAAMQRQIGSYRTAVKVAFEDMYVELENERSRQAELISQIDAYRNRLSCRLADHLAKMVRRVPMVRRVGRVYSQVVAHRRRR
jgi:chromosome segregation ATPase